jgi:hypothetical protein
MREGGEYKRIGKEDGRGRRGIDLKRRREGEEE